MIIHREASLAIGYGDISSSFDPQYQEHYKNHTPETIIRIEPFNRFQDVLSISCLAKSQQVHGIDGVVIQERAHVPPPFANHADYLITNCPDIGLAVATADCLPIVFYDPRHGAAGIAHAGWRGLAYGIVSEVVTRMQQEYGTVPDELRVFLGPAAGRCCYEVGEDLIGHFSSMPFSGTCVQAVEHRLYLDLAECALIQLQQLGVPRASCQKTYNHCTICTIHYASHRRQGNTARRQLTVVCLK